MGNKKSNPIPGAVTVGIIASIVFQSTALASYGNEDYRFSLPAILRSLGAQDWQRRQEIERLLNEHKAEAPTLLTNALDSPDPEVQKNASEMLSRMAANWEFVISDRSLATIIGIMKSTHSSPVKSNLVRVLGHVGPLNERIQPLVLEMMKKDEDASVRSAAADALASLMREEKASAAEEAVKVMCYCLKNDISPHVRRSVAQAMGNLPGPSELVIDALAQAMEDNYKTVRTTACSSLSRFGARAKPALPLLLKMYRDENDAFARQSTLNALVQIDRKNPRVVEVVVAALDEPQLISSALIYLQQLGVDAAPAVPRLIKILEPENNLNVRVQSAQTLGSIGPAAEKALPLLTKLSETSDGALKDTVDNAIRRISVSKRTEPESGGAVL